jgi:hypothetical protein
MNATADTRTALLATAARLRAEADRLEALAGADGAPVVAPSGWWSVGDAVAQGFYCEYIVGNLTDLCACLRVRKPRTLKRMVRDGIIFVAPDVGARSWALHFRSRERYIAAVKILAAKEPQSAITSHKLRVMLESATEQAETSGPPQTARV